MTYVVNTHQRAICPTCKRNVAITHEGVMYSHRDDDHERCEGSGGIGEPTTEQPDYDANYKRSHNRQPMLITDEITTQ
jgi:hypothetical protein